MAEMGWDRQAIQGQLVEQDSDRLGLWGQLVGVGLGQLVTQGQQAEQDP